MKLFKPESAIGDISVAIAKEGIIGEFELVRGEKFTIHFTGSKFFQFDFDKNVFVELDLKFPVVTETTATVTEDTTAPHTRDCTTREFKGRMPGRRKNVNNKLMSAELRVYVKLSKEKRKEHLRYWGIKWNVKSVTVGVWLANHKKVKKVEV